MFTRLLFLKGKFFRFPAVFSKVPGKGRAFRSPAVAEANRFQGLKTRRTLKPGIMGFFPCLQTGRAIRFAVDHVFSSTQRASQVKNRIAVVLTDGKSQDDVVSETLAQSRIRSVMQQSESDGRFCRWTRVWRHELRESQCLLWAWAARSPPQS